MKYYYCGWVIVIVVTFYISYCKRVTIKDIVTILTISITKFDNFYTSGTQ